jgi:cobalt-zinc-cadmium efflux system outer membrane protein
MFRVLFLACVVLSAPMCFSDNPAGGLTLDRAVAIALEHHAGVRALKAEMNAANAMRQQASLRPNPEVAVSAGYKEAGEENGYAFDAEIIFPVERKGKREVRMALSESDAQLAEADLNQLLREVELQVRTLGYEYLASATDAETAQEIADRSSSMIEMLKQRPAAGAVILLEQRVIEGSLVEFQQSARELSVQRDVARSELNVLLQREPDAPLDLNEKLISPTMRFDEKKLRETIDKSPVLQFRMAEHIKSSYEVKAARFDAKPDYSIGPFVSREDAGEEETVVGLSFSIPLAVRNRNQGSLAAAVARQDKADAQLAADTQWAHAELARLIRLYDSALANVDAIPASQVENLHDAADLADRQYRLGAIPVQLFLDTQHTFLTVQQLRHNALLEAWRHAAQLQKLTGPATEAIQ